MPNDVTWTNTQQKLLWSHKRLQWKNHQGTKEKSRNYLCYTKDNNEETIKVYARKIWKHLYKGIVKGCNEEIAKAHKKNEKTRGHVLECQK